MGTPLQPARPPALRSFAEELSCLRSRGSLLRRRPLSWRLAWPRAAAQVVAGFPVARSYRENVAVAPSSRFGKSCPCDPLPELRLWLCPHLKPRCVPGCLALVSPKSGALCNDEETQNLPPASVGERNWFLELPW